ncbi:post-GPI attachment to proteins factor 2-like [Ruditapes philippinarum]|uniref:post-GPI attachment to proteins factor 2-like n=1 Tax=Ruditapes philippinarum TaxID=129788 RepID=UPI00295C2EFD|nr:post-GPI attachment to proteins factor 2-like [Ruditapes philippinarum]
MKHVSISLLGFVAVGFPLFGFLFAIVWSIIYDYDASVRTVCHVSNFLPTISSAIGGFTPQRYIWRICIALQAGLRFMLAFCYYNWHLRIHIGQYQAVYKKVVSFAITCHVIENLALVILSSISSTDNGDVHEYSFIIFMVCSQVYMLVSCILISWTHRSATFKVTAQDVKWLRVKWFLFIFNLAIFLLSVYLYFRHNEYCEPYIYSWFALGEYLTILSNIAFHGLCCVDFQQYSFTVLDTEDISTGRFKDS